MKTIKFLTLALLAIIAVSCSKNSDTVSPASPSVAEQKSIVASTGWKVTYFMERGINETSNFSGLRFAFNTDGTAIVTGSSVTYTGSWNLTQSNSKPDDSGHHSSPESKMNILITGSKYMDEISEDWKILRLTASEIWLADDNPASPKEIHFSIL